MAKFKSKSAVSLSLVCLLWKQNGSGRILIVQSNFKILHKGSKLAPGQDAAAYYCVNVFEALQCVAQWLRKQF